MTRFEAIDMSLLKLLLFSGKAYILICIRCERRHRSTLQG